MIDIKIKTSFDIKKILDKCNKSVSDELQHAAAIIRKDMKASLNKTYGGKPAPAGSPPGKKSGKLYRSILFGMDGENTVVIGSKPRSRGWYGRLHEHGGAVKSRGKKYKIFKPGDKAPIRIDGDKVIFARVTSQAAAERATRLNRKIGQERLVAVSRNKLASKSVMINYETTGEFPKRPFARPALMRNLHVIPRAFRDSILNG